MKLEEFTETMNEYVQDGALVKSAMAEKPKRKRAARRMPELWAVVEMPDGSRQAYTCVSKALQIAGEALVREVQLCRISPKSRGFKVVEVVKV